MNTKYSRIDPLKSITPTRTHKQTLKRPNTHTRTHSHTQSMNNSIRYAPASVLYSYARILCTNPNAHLEPTTAIVDDSVDVTSEPLEQDISVAASHITPNKRPQLEVQLGGAVTLQCPQGKSHSHDAPIVVGASSPGVGGRMPSRIATSEKDKPE